MKKMKSIESEETSKQEKMHEQKTQEEAALRPSGANKKRMPIVIVGQKDWRLRKKKKSVSLVIPKTILKEPKKEKNDDNEYIPLNQRAQSSKEAKEERR